MKNLYYLFILVSFCHSLYPISYVNSLDSLINQKVTDLATTSKDIEGFVRIIKSNIKNSIALQEIDEFLNDEHSIAFFFCDQVQPRLDQQFFDKDAQKQKSLKDLNFALGAKLYMYYLECSKQKMLYKAVKNYDALNYWINEKFYESQSFYQKNIFRWLSRSAYQERIHQNIVQLQQVTQQTNSFLGLVIYNQNLLQQATTQQEFQQSLMVAVKLQNELLHLADGKYENYSLGYIVKDSIEQVCQLSGDISVEYAQCQFPSHAERHWKEYTMAAVGLCACAFVYANYGGAITQASDNFYKDHIKGPWDRNKETFFEKARGPHLDVQNNKDMLKASICAEAKGLEALDDKYTVLESFMIHLNDSSHDELRENCELIVPKLHTLDLTAQKIVDIVGTIEYILPYVVNVVNHAATADQKVRQTSLFGGLWALSGRGVITPVNNLLELDKVPLAVIKPWDPLIYPIIKPYVLYPGRPYSKENMPSLDIPKPKPLFDDLNVSYEEMEDKVFKNDTKILAFFDRNGLRSAGALGRMGLREAIDGKNELNKVLNDMHVTLGLTALIPMITLLCGSLFASKKLYNSVVYQPIRTLVRRLEAYLNESFYQPTSFDRQGHVYFLTEQLKLHAHVLTMQEQRLIDADITSLQSNDLDYVQKFNVVQRMYRTYPCLAITATV